MTDSCLKNSFSDEIDPFVFSRVFWSQILKILSPRF